MISKGLVFLFRKSENYNEVCVYITRSEKIITWWRRKNVERIKNTRVKERKILRNLKINGCAICGYNKCNRALDFHHVNPEDKKFSVLAAQFYRKSKIITEEVNKCILLCKNCHYEIHDKEQEYDKHN